MEPDRNPQSSSTDEPDDATTGVTKATGASGRGDGDRPGTSAMTVLDKPVSSGRGRRFLGADVVTPRDAMRLDEIQSTRVFLVAGGLLAASVFAALPFLEADPIATRIFIGTMVVAVASLSWAGWALTKPDGYRLVHGLALAGGGGIAGYAAIYYFGILSAASLATVMGIFFFALTHRLVVAVVAYAGASAGPVVLWLLIIGDVVDDRGVMKIESMDRVNQFVLVMLIQCVFAITFIIARGSRRSRLAATEELEQAVRQVAQREALLDEARRELDQALKVGGPGRFTDQQFGSYKLGVLVGRGAMGEVYEAVHVRSRRVAAVKLLSRDVLGDVEQVRRFIREAGIAKSLRTPHIVAVLEVGDSRAPLPYLAMELLQGEDLAQILRRETRLDADVTLDMLDQVAQGIDVAHAASVVHRDLKPQNLFLHEPDAGPPVWKILDFGVSRLLDAGGTLTQGQAIGTPSYMAPEQARGRTVDHRADLFALAVVAYRCLTGRPAFSGKDVPQILHSVVYATPPKPSSLVDVPEDVDYAFAIALAKRVDNRVKTAGELVQLLGMAVHESLDEPTRALARRLIQRYPWGSRLK